MPAQFTRLAVRRPAAMNRAAVPIELGDKWRSAPCDRAGDARKKMRRDDCRGRLQDARRRIDQP